jgi:hypothetical protein
MIGHWWQPWQQLQCPLNQEYGYEPVTLLLCFSQVMLSYKTLLKLSCRHPLGRQLSSIPSTAGAVKQIIQVIPAAAAAAAAAHRCSKQAWHVKACRNKLLQY